MTEKAFETNQEYFWAGEFGDNYIQRNKGKELLASNLFFFAEILKHTREVNSVLEFGANVGMNLKALDLLLPNALLAAVEINEKACKTLNNELSKVKTYNQSILNFNNDKQYSFVLVKGLLIHINPDKLDSVYDKLFSCSSKYICVAEYYNPTPVTVSYRGHKEKLFKRDFAGELLEKYSNLELVHHQFHYKRDPLFPQDDITWFLLEKRYMENS